MKSFKKRFNNLLLKEEQEWDNPRYDAEADAQAFNDNFVDPDTDSDEYLTQGLKDSFDAVMNSFNEKMAGFAQSMSPDATQSMTLGEIKDKVGKIFKYVSGIQVYTKGKIDQMAQSPQAILAGFVASDPAQLAAFNDLHKKLEKFTEAVEETQTEISTIQSKIEEFIEDHMGEEDAEEYDPENEYESIEDMGSEEDFGEEEFEPSPYEQPQR